MVSDQPDDKSIGRWHDQFGETSTQEKSYSVGLRIRSDKTGFHEESEEGYLPCECTVTGAIEFFGRKTRKLHVAQKLTAYDKEIRLQFVAHIYIKTLEHFNFLNYVVCINEAKFHISGIGITVLFGTANLP
jgi:hypothetical protein